FAENVKEKVSFPATLEIFDTSGVVTVTVGNVVSIEMLSTAIDEALCTSSRTRMLIVLAPSPVESFTCGFAEYGIHCEATSVAWTLVSFVGSTEPQIFIW